MEQKLIDLIAAEMFCSGMKFLLSIDAVNKIILPERKILRWKFEVEIVGETKCVGSESGASTSE